jgi:tetratricopeptide (TPR) repeat protein
MAIARNDMQHSRKFGLLTLVFCSLFFSNIWAQQTKTDSLLTVIKSAEEDSNKVNTLNLLAWEIVLTTGDYEKTVEYCNQAIQLSEKINYKKGHAKALNILGAAYMFQGDYPTALQNYEASLVIKKEMEDKKGIASAYSNIGLVYMYQGDYPKSLKNLKSALKMETELDDKEGMAGSYNNIGVVYEELGNYPEALNNYLESLKMKEEVGDKKGIANTLSNIGAIKELQRNFSEALKYHQAALKIRQELEDQRGISETYNNIGNIHKELGNYPEALRSHFISLKVFEETGNQPGIASCYNNIGLIYEAQGDSALKRGDTKLALTHRYPQALRSYAASFKLRSEIGDKIGVAASSNNMGRVSIRLGKYSDARMYLVGGLDTAMSIGSKKTIKDSYQQLSVLDSTTGNMGGAFENYKLFIVYRDSLFNEENAEKSAMTQMQFDIERGDEAEARTEEKRRKEVLRRNQLEYSAIAFIVLLVLVSVMLLGRIKVPAVLARGLSFVALLLVFESLLVFLDQWLDVWTGGTPAKKLLVNIALAILIFPLNNLLEKKVKKRLKVE